MLWCINISSSYGAPRDFRTRFGSIIAVEDLAGPSSSFSAMGPRELFEDTVFSGAFRIKVNAFSDSKAKGV